MLILLKIGLILSFYPKDKGITKNTQKEQNNSILSTFEKNQLSQRSKCHYYIEHRSFGDNLFYQSPNYKASERNLKIWNLI